MFVILIIVESRCFRISVTIIIKSWSDAAFKFLTHTFFFVPNVVLYVLLALISFVKDFPGLCIIFTVLIY